LVATRDVAKLYQTETKVINQVVKRNLNRFPEDFCFQLTKEESDIFCSRSQFVTLNKSDNKRGSNIKYLPYVFTEHGIMMLSGLLKSEIAVKVNVSIIKAFVEIRKYVSNNLIEQQYINKLVLEDHESIKLLQESFNKMNNLKNYDGLFFKNQIYDSYSLLLDILNSSRNEIIIIDNYIDKKILDVLRRINTNIMIITNKYNNEDYEKYIKQYKNITLKIDNSIHDRFIIIDRKELYHCGASLKDIGKKCFAITEIKNQRWLNDILKSINI